MSFPSSSFLSLCTPSSLFPCFLLLSPFCPFYCLFLKDFYCLSPMLGFSRWDILRCKKTLKIAYALFNVFQKQLSRTNLMIPDGRKPHIHNIRIILRQYYHTVSLIHSMYSNSTYSVYLAYARSTAIIFFSKTCHLFHFIRNIYILYIIIILYIYYIYIYIYILY